MHWTDSFYRLHWTDAFVIFTAFLTCILARTYHTRAKVIAVALPFLLIQAIYLFYRGLIVPA